MTKCVGFFGVCLSIVAIFATPHTSLAIDFYEIEIYDTDTTPAGHLQLELHSNTTSTATGHLAKSQMDVYQLHETVEGTYGVLRWLEVGQYFCTAKLSNGDYEYSGSRTKVHFGIPQTFVRAPVEKSLKERPDRPAAPEQKSGNRRSSAKMGRGRRDERRGTVRAGAASGVCGGDEPAGGGAAVWDRPADGSEDAGVLGAAGIPAEPATGAAEAGSVRWDD